MGVEHGALGPSRQRDLDVGSRAALCGDQPAGATSWAPRLRWSGAGTGPVIAPGEPREPARLPRRPVPEVIARRSCAWATLAFPESAALVRRSHLPRRTQRPGDGRHHRTTPAEAPVDVTSTACPRLTRPHAGRGPPGRLAAGARLAGRVAQASRGAVPPGVSVERGDTRITVNSTGGHTGAVRWWRPSRGRSMRRERIDRRDESLTPGGTAPREAHARTPHRGAC